MVDGFNLEELDNVVGYWEDDDGQDVAEPVVHVQLQNDNNLFDQFQSSINELSL